jgi:flagellar protein FlbD
VILLTRLNGPVFALNPDLVERADSTPDTVITLVDGTKYVVAESLAELVALIRQYRAGVVADAQHLVGQPEEPAHPADTRRHTDLRHTDLRQADPRHTDADDVPAPQAHQDNVVQLHRRER